MLGDKELVGYECLTGMMISMMKMMTMRIHGNCTAYPDLFPCILFIIVNNSTYVNIASFPILHSEKILDPS